MAIQETRTLPPQFIQDLGEDLSKQILAQTGVPTVATGLAGISKRPGESDDDFAARQQAAREFETRQQSLKGLAPTVEDQDVLQQAATRLGAKAAGVDPVTGEDKGIASFQPFLDKAQERAAAADALGVKAFDRLGTAADTLGGVPLGAPTTQQVQDFMSPYQSQVIEATLDAFDKNIKQQQLRLRDEQAKLGVLGTGRAGVQLAELGTGAAKERALIEAGLLQQGFGQAMAARQQDIANRFGLGQAQSGIAGATQSLGAFQSGLAGQQIGLGQAQEGVLGTNIARLGSLGALNQAQAQAKADADREAARQAAFLPQQNLDRYAAQVTGIMGGYPGQTTQTAVPNPTPLQTALGVGTTLAGIYTGFNPPVQRYQQIPVK